MKWALTQVELLLHYQEAMYGKVGKRNSDSNQTRLNSPWDVPSERDSTLYCTFDLTLTG